MANPRSFKVGGFKLRDFRAALGIEEQTLTTVNRQVKLQLNRLREEYDVLTRRQAKLDRLATKKRQEEALSEDHDGEDDVVDDEVIDDEVVDDEVEDVGRPNRSKPKQKPKRAAPSITPTKKRRVNPTRGAANRKASTCPDNDNEHNK